jgi:hypothetical protein
MLNEASAMATAPSLVERSAAFHRATGLNPVGMQRSTADRLLRRVSHRCRDCNGQGFRRVGNSWLWCRVCDGLGRMLTPRALSLLRRRVADRYPAAGLGLESSPAD